MSQHSPSSTIKRVAFLILLTPWWVGAPLAHSASASAQAPKVSMTAAHSKVGRHHFSDSPSGKAGAVCTYGGNHLRSIPLSPPRVAAYSGNGSSGTQFVRWLAELQFHAKTWQVVFTRRSTYRTVEVGGKSVRLPTMTLHLSKAVSAAGSYRVIETIQAYNGSSDKLAGVVHHKVRNYHLTKPVAVVRSCPEFRHLARPGAASDVFAGNVTTLSKNSQGEPTSVQVGLRWAAPKSGGKPSCYLVRWTLMNSIGNQDSKPAASPHSLRCTTSRTETIKIKPDDTASTWIRWQVAGRNSAGHGAWATARGVVPHMVGDQVPDAYQDLRIAGLVPNPTDLGTPPSPSQAFEVATQTPTRGRLVGGTYVSISFYGG